MAINKNKTEEEINYSKKLDLIIEKNKNKASALQKIMGAIDEVKNKTKSTLK